MYSYQHRYHAGNFADIHKHLVLTAILHSFLKKETPFAVLDAFAGEGVYDLQSQESQRNKEYLQGFAALGAIPENLTLFQEINAIAGNYQGPGRSLVYPGSPAIINHYLRSQDRGIYIENHPQAYRELSRYFRDKENAHLHRRDGFEAIHGLIPFPEKRGLIFINPSYEVKQEYEIGRAHV